MSSFAFDALGFDRRMWLRGLAGGVVSCLLPALPGRAAERRGAERPKSLLTIWLGGGASQLETWDPHPGTASGGPTGAVESSIPGVQIGEDYPQTAAVLSHLCVVRSLVSKEGDHERGTYHLKTGFRPDPSVKHPSLGALLVHERSPTAAVALPPHVALAAGAWPPKGGFLGDQYDAFRVADPGQPLANIASQVQTPRQSRRLDALAVLERSFSEKRPHQGGRTLHRQTLDDALTLMDSPQLVAFEAEREPAAVRAAYGDSTFGRGCLVARRLIEAGVQAVEVTLDGFDSHADNFRFHREKAAVLDPALATLVADLAARDLLDSTVLLVLSEFGRTPKINALDGRDHWPTGFSCLVGGAGMQSGRVIGSTDPAGKRPPTRPVAIADLTATVLAALGLDPATELYTPLARPIRLSDGAALQELLTA